MIGEAEPLAILVAPREERTENVKRGQPSLSVIEQLFIVGEPATHQQFNDRCPGCHVHDADVDPFWNVTVAPEHINYLLLGQLQWSLHRRVCDFPGAQQRITGLIEQREVTHCVGERFFNEPLAEFAGSACCINKSLLEDGAIQGASLGTT